MQHEEREKLNYKKKCHDKMKNVFLLEKKIQVSDVMITGLYVLQTNLK